jgi:hypothetical protein
MSVVELRLLDEPPEREEVESQLRADWPDVPEDRIQAALDWLFKEKGK